MELPDHLYEFGPAKLELGIAATRQRRYAPESGKSGWFYYDRLGDLSKRGKLICNHYPAGARPEFGGQSAPKILTLDRKYLKGIMLRPLLRQCAHVVEATQEYVPGWSATDFTESFALNGGMWSVDISKNGLRWEATQLVAYTGDGTSPTDWTVSELTTTPGCPGGISPDPFFSVYIRRSEATQEIITNLAALGKVTAAYTAIVWGDNSWMLVIPSQGAPKLYHDFRSQPPDGYFYPWPQWWPVTWTEGHLAEVDAKRASEEGYEYQIGTIGGCVCVSENGFTNDDFAYYRVENTGEPVVPIGGVTIRNWPGQCTLGLDLSIFPDDALAYRSLWEVGDFCEPSTAQGVFGQPFASVWADSVVEPTVTSALEGVDDNSVSIALHESDTYPGYAYYWLGLTRGQFPNAAYIAEHSISETLLTYTTPFVEAVSTYQFQTLTDRGAYSFTDTGLFRRGMTMEAALDTGQSQHFVATVCNEPAAVPASETAWHAVDQSTTGFVGLPPTYKLEPGQVVRLRGGRTYKVRNWTPPEEEGDPETPYLDAVIDLGQYTIVSALRNRHEGKFDLTDVLGLTNLAKWTCGELNLRGWDSNAAMEFLLDLSNIGAAERDLENLDTAGMIADSEDRASWDRGETFNKIMSELADKYGHHAALWYDIYTNQVKTGCRYCRTKRTNVETETEGVFEWMTHEDNGWLSSGCLAADLVRVPDTGIDLRFVDDPVYATDPQSMYICKEFTAEIASLDPDKFANEFVVVGKDQYSEDGPTNRSFADEIVGKWRNLASLTYGESTKAQYLGFPVTHFEEDSALTSRVAVNQRLIEAARWKGNWPRVAEVRMPLHIDFETVESPRPGMVFVVEGAKYAACHGVKFRVTNVTLDLGSREQIIKGREMVGLYTG
mgnify:CR=1 FL=1